MSAFTGTNRRIAKAAVVGAVGVAIALGGTACSAGKISQTNNQAAAVNGANGSLTLPPLKNGDLEAPSGTIALRNVQIMYPIDEADEVFGKGGPFKLVFTIANDSATRQVKLTNISAAQGAVNIVDDSSGRTIGPNSALTAGTPALLDEEAAKNDKIKRADVELTGTGDAVAAGLTLPLTFHFDILDLDGNVLQRDASVIIETPVDSTALNDRVDQVRDAQPHHDDSHGDEGGH